MKLFSRDIADLTCACKVWGVSPIAGASGFNTLNWLHLDFQIGGAWWNPSDPSVLTPPRDGLYIITAKTQFAAAPMDIIVFDKLSGARVIEASSNTSNGGIFGVTGLLRLKKGQQLYSQAWSNTVQTIGADTYNYSVFEIAKIGEFR